MSNLNKSRQPLFAGRPARRGLVLLAAAAVLVSACGSGGTSSSGQSSDSSDAASATSAAVAGAQENAVGSSVCFDWPSGTVAKACAVGLKGPGGGRVFYDAGSEQPWGRFLEVAPQNWNGTLYDCRSCGAAAGVTKQSTDTRGIILYLPCREKDDALTAARAVALPGEAADTLWEIGGGRHNTEVLMRTPECVNGSVSALTLAAGYRGGGLSDWFLPSGGELTALCKYAGRNDIGGFEAEKYVSSTVGPKSGFSETGFFLVSFTGDPLCERSDNLSTDRNVHNWSGGAVRPIRAFSQSSAVVGSGNGGNTAIVN